MYVHALQRRKIQVLNISFFFFMGDVIVLEMWLWMYYFLVHENVSIENSTQYGRLKNNGKPSKPKTEKTL